MTEYMDGALPADLRTRVEAHLAGCDGCAEYLDQMVRTSALLRAAAAAGGGGETVTLSDDACATLTEAFRDWVDARPNLDGRAGY